MIAYLDTSVLVPLIIAEDGTEACQRLWNDADAIVTCRLTYVESAAALAQAERMEWLTSEQHDEAMRLLDRLWSQVEIAEVDEHVVTRAAVLAHRYALRGYDAVHCATAEQLDDEGVVAASGGHQLLTAWAELGVESYDPNAVLDADDEKAEGER